MDSYICNRNSIRYKNKQRVDQDIECQKKIAEMRVVEGLLSDFGLLSFGRNIVCCGRHVFSLQMISTASELTAGSIISCCESGCIADAYSLMRKYRDDMFFYLYIVVYDTCNKLDSKSTSIDKMEANIERWINNDLNDLHIGTVLYTIGQSQKVKEAVQKYNLKSYFDNLGDRLNNYLHSNGMSFYNRNVNAYQGKELQKQLDMLVKDMCFITVTFIFLLSICSPLSIMSTDYEDYLDCNMTPPDGSQYWVAPFVTDFFKSNLDLIDESCMKYLRENTFMEFE